MFNFHKFGNFRKLCRNNFLIFCNFSCYKIFDLIFSFNFDDRYKFLPQKGCYKVFVIYFFEFFEISLEKLQNPLYKIFPKAKHPTGGTSRTKNKYFQKQPICKF